MRLVKVKKKIFKREFLDYRLTVVVFDIYEMSNQDENTVIEMKRVFWVVPSTTDGDVDLQIPSVAGVD